MYYYAIGIALKLLQIKSVNLLLMKWTLQEQKSVMALTEKFLKWSMKERCVLPEKYSLHQYVHRVLSKPVTRSFKTVFYTSVRSGANYTTRALSNL